MVSIVHCFDAVLMLYYYIWCIGGVTWCMDAFTKTLPMFETYFKVCTWLLVTYNVVV